MLIDKQKKFNLYFSLLSITYFLLSMWFTLYLLCEGANYKRDMKAATDIQNFEDRLLNAKEWLYPHYEWSGKKKHAEETILSAEKDLINAYILSVVFLAVTLLYVFIVWRFFRSTWRYKLFISITLVNIGVICLITGIFFPMLEISAYSRDLTIPLKLEIPFAGKVDLSKSFEGRLYYYYQCKSIADLIILLYGSGNIIVGTAILCFSVLMPVSKMLFSLAILLSGRVRKLNFITWYVNNIGKWSMADVFVASVFLAYLSFNNMNTGIDTESRTLPGMYYFFAYVVISIFSSYNIKKTTILNNNKNNTIEFIKFQ